MHKCCKTLFNLWIWPPLTWVWFKFATMHPHLLPHREREKHEEEAIKKLVQYQTFKPILFGSIIISTRRRFFFIYLDQVQRKPSETEWHRDCAHDVGIWRDKTDVERGQQRTETLPLCLTFGFELPEENSYWEVVPPLPSSGVSSSTGSRRCSFFVFVDAACTSRFPKIPELNTCARDELHAYSEAYERIGKHLAAQSSSLSAAELARFHTDPKRAFWVIFRRSCSATLACLPSQQLRK